MLRALGVLFAIIATGWPPVASAAISINTVETIGDVGYSPAVAIGIDQLPVISYLQRVPVTYTNFLKIAKCANLDCSASPTITPVALEGTIRNGGIAIPSDGRPVAAFIQDGVTKVLKCGDAACANGNTITPLLGRPGDHHQAAIALSGDGLPVVAFAVLVSLMPHPYNALTIAKCANVSCSEYSLVNVSDFVGSFAMAVGQDGNPMVAFAEPADHHGRQAALKFRRCSNQSCTSIGDISTIELFGLAFMPSMAVAVDGFPVIAYWHSPPSGTSTESPRVTVAKCWDMECSDSRSINTVMTTIGNGPEGLAVIIGGDGLPLVLSDGSVAHCGNPSCSAASTVTKVIPEASSDSATAIAVGADGIPVLPFLRVDGLDLMVARCDTADCQSLGAEASPGQGDTPLAVITSFEGHALTLVDTKTHAVVSIVDVGQSPEGVAISSDARRAYVTNLTSGTVSYVDLVNRRIERTIPTSAGIPAAPRGIAVSPDDARLYVANSASNSVAIVDRSTGSIVKSIAVGVMPFGLAISPNGSRVVSANTVSENATIIDTASGDPLITLPVGKQPYGVAISPDSTIAYVANFGSNSVSRIDLASQTTMPPIAVGVGPFGVAVSPDGTRLYVTDNANQVSIVDVGASATVASLTAGNHPQGIAVTPDGQFLYVANQLSNSITVIDASSKETVATIFVPDAPVSLGRFISPSTATKAIAVEFFHSGFGHYFVTAQTDEIAGLDSGVFAGWTRTGQSWNVWNTNSGYANVCRFFTTAFAPKSSHFYTQLASECETVDDNPDWDFEKMAFQVRLRDGGSCPAGTMPLYRLYNGGKTGAPNHRYTTSLAIRDQMIDQGFVPEDANTACVPN